MAFPSIVAALVGKACPMSESPGDSAGAKPQHWSRLREAGTYSGLKFLLLVHRLFGRKGFSLVLYGVALYFALFRPVARQASREFLTTHYKMHPSAWTRPPNLLHVVKHFYAFGQSVLDKLLGWVAPISAEEFAIANPEALSALLDDPQGQLIIGSHLGNLEYCRGFMQRYKSKPINVLLYDRHAANFVRMMQSHSPQSRVHVYQVDELDIPTLLKLREKIDAGEWLFIAGDRVPVTGDQRTTVVEFLGRPARLPIGPYMLAKTLQCKVKLMFSYRLKSQVRFEVIAFSDGIDLPRNHREAAVQAYAQCFASELQRQCLDAPFQWFNFFPFWDQALVPKNGPPPNLDSANVNKTA